MYLGNAYSYIYKTMASTIETTGNTSSNGLKSPKPNDSYSVVLIITIEKNDRPTLIK